ncbi:MAG: DUF493 domain-containing protein [Gammaproteobacteria bacterium]|nr:DUF493 domain-containing protein [Gammaproteobacteria bacterium]
MGKRPGNGNGIQSEDLIEFPCKYEVKAMGLRSVRFEALVQEIVSRHIGATDLRATQSRSSRNDRYVSISCVVWVTRREQLERIYGDLRDCPEVLMTL